jgi:hypothetical protein
MSGIPAGLPRPAFLPDLRLKNRMRARIPSITPANTVKITITNAAVFRSIDPFPFVLPSAAPDRLLSLADVVAELVLVGIDTIVMTVRMVGLKIGVV